MPTTAVVSYCVEAWDSAAQDVVIEVEACRVAR